MRPTSEKAKSASKVSSRSHLGERVPRLRFPGFKGEWEVFRIKDILSLSDGDWIESEDQSPSGIRLVQTGNIGEGEFKDHLERARFISETTFHRLHCSEIFPGDCLISRLPDPIGRACVVPESCYRMITAVDCAIARPRNTKFDIRFFVFISGTPQYKKQMQLSITGSTRPRISRAFLDDVRISLPKVSEQSKIIEFLSLLDDCIAAQRKLVELLKKHKRGLSNALFSGKLRLVNDAKWKVYRLGDIVRRVTRKNGTASDVPLTISAQHGLIDQREFFSKSVASADMSGYYLLKQGEFAYNRSSSGDCPFGSIKRLERYAQGAVSTLYICFEAIGDSDDSEFLKWYFDSFAWHREVGMICAEGARNHGLLNVPTEGFFDTKHLLPSDKEERKKMAMFMALEAARCERIECELARLTELKSGFLQQMFA